MGEANYNLLQPGISVYHHRGLIVPILVCVLPFFLAKYPPFPWLEQQHHLFAAFALGALMTLLAWLCFKYVPLLKDDQYTLNKAVLLGLLVAEVLIFTYPRQSKFKDRIVSAPILVFFLLMYLIAVSEIHKD